MYQEKIIKPISGYLAAAAFFILLGISIICFYFESFTVGGLLLSIDFVLIMPGFIIVNPNESKVLSLFGQ